MATRTFDYYEKNWQIKRKYIINRCVLCKVFKQGNDLHDLELGFGRVFGLKFLEPNFFWDLNFFEIQNFSGTKNFRDPLFFEQTFTLNYHATHCFCFYTGN